VPISQVAWFNLPHLDQITVATDFKAEVMPYPRSKPEAEAVDQQQQQSFFIELT